MNIVLLAVAIAGSPAFYHPDDIAAKSTRFAAAAQAIEPRFAAGEAAAARWGDAVADLELGAAMLGKDAPAELTTWVADTRRQLTGQFLRLQRHAGLVQEDFSAVFGAALGRVLPAVAKGYDARECKATGIAAMMRRTTCEGEDLSPALARALDADPALEKEIADILSVEWPTVALEPRTWAPAALTGTARWVDGAAVAEAFTAARVQSRKDALDARLDPLQDGLEARDPAVIAAAQAERARYVAALGEDGAFLRAALTEALVRGEKKGGPAQVGWCPNPAALGGCVGEDVTRAVVERLREDRRFVDAVGD